MRKGVVRAFARLSRTCCIAYLIRRVDLDIFRRQVASGMCAVHLSAVPACTGSGTAPAPPAARGTGQASPMVPTKPQQRAAPPAAQPPIPSRAQARPTIPYLLPAVCRVVAVCNSLTCCLHRWPQHKSWTRPGEGRGVPCRNALHLRRSTSGRRSSPGPPPQRWRRQSPPAVWQSPPAARVLRHRYVCMILDPLAGTS